MVLGAGDITYQPLTVTAGSITHAGVPTGPGPVVFTGDTLRSTPTPSPTATGTGMGGESVTQAGMGGVSGATGTTSTATAGMPRVTGNAGVVLGGVVAAVGIAAVGL